MEDIENSETSQLNQVQGSEDVEQLNHDFWNEDEDVAEEFIKKFDKYGKGYTKGNVLCASIIFLLYFNDLFLKKKSNENIIYTTARIITNISAIGGPLCVVRKVLKTLIKIHLLMELAEGIYNEETGQLEPFYHDEKGAISVSRALCFLTVGATNCFANRAYKPEYQSGSKKEITGVLKLLTFVPLINSLVYFYHYCNTRTSFKISRENIKLLRSS